MEENTAIGLVSIQNNVPLTTSYIIAEKLGIEHKSLMQLIRDHKARIEKHFGVLRFQNDKPLPGSAGGRPEQFVKLTENQAHYILTLSRNTDEAMEVKALFVKAFDEAKQQITTLHNHIAQTEAKLQELLNDLGAELDSVPRGFTASQRDLADLTITRVRHLIYQMRDFLQEAQSKRKIGDQACADLLQKLTELSHQNKQLHTLIQDDLELEHDFTKILMDYRGVLGKLTPEHKLLH